MKLTRGGVTIAPCPLPAETVRWRAWGRLDLGAALRMRRRLFNIASALSATVCLLALLLALDASVHPDRYDRLLLDVSLPGNLQLHLSDSVVLRTREHLHNEEWVNGRLKGIAQFNSELFKFRFQVDYWNYSTTTSNPPPEDRGPIAGWTVGVPFSFAILISAPMPCISVARRARQRKRLRRWERDACEQCGYDLRATPARCPECGTARAGAVK
jgi:hypothetical protein